MTKKRLNSSQEDLLREKEDNRFKYPVTTSIIDYVRSCGFLNASVKKTDEKPEILPRK